MEHSELTWEEVIQYEEVKGYGQQIWKHKGQYYLGHPEALKYDANAQKYFTRNELEKIY